MMNGKDIQAASQQAIRLLQAGRALEAEAVCMKILDADPKHHLSLNLLGMMTAQTGRLDIATDFFRRAIEIFPNDPGYHSNLGYAYQQMRRLYDSAAAHRRALQIDPTFANAHFNLANTLVELDDLQAAAHHYQQVPSTAQAALAACRNLGEVQHRLGHVDDAICTFMRVIQSPAKSAQDCFAIAVAYEDAARPDDAILAYREAIRLDLGLTKAVHNLARVLHERGDFNDAISLYRRAINAAPTEPSSHFAMGLSLLAQGNFEEGWKELEWRWKLPDRSSKNPNFPQPLWDGRALPEQRILIHCEQGFGDCIQFARYIPMVAARVGRVYIDCYPDLVAVFSGYENDRVTIVPRGQPLPAFDVHCPLVSMPRAFKTKPESIPATVPYLKAPTDAVTKWSDRFREDTNLRVGLAWAGGTKSRNVGYRTMTLDNLQPVLQTDGVSFYSLQKGGNARQQLLALDESIRPIDLSSDLTDFGQTAAAMENLDLVISVDTSVAHLAAALGRPTWILLANVPEWRWPFKSDTTPWYPTAKLFWQKSSGRWEEVISAIQSELLARLKR